MAITLLSPVNDIYRRDVSVDNNNLVTPSSSDCLVAGEWVILNSSDQASATSRLSTSPLAFQVFTEKGDYSAQALGKVTLLNSFDYVAETDQYTGSITNGTFLAINGDGVLATASSGDTAVAVALNSATSGSAPDLKYQRISPMQLN